MLGVQSAVRGAQPCQQHITSGRLRGCLEIGWSDAVRGARKLTLWTALLCAQVSRIFEWVSDALRQPGRTYELITPARRPLVTSAGNLKQADLLPSSLLNFRRVLASSHVHIFTV